MTKISTFSVTVKAKKYLTENMLEIQCTRPDGFDYAAGQFVQCMIPGRERETVRSYSLSTTPADDYIEFCVKYIEGGIGSEFFKGLSVGDSFDVRGPLGRFTVNENIQGHVFIATGAGLAPIYGMIRDELEQKERTHPLYLIFGLRHEEHIFWLDRLDALAAQYDHFEYQLTLSRPGDTWEGMRGRVTDHLADHNVQHNFYVCGAPAMVKDVRHILIQKNVPSKNIRFEVF